ncbi:MAG: RagB/SusD family nutrient uptake outer membrane protein [Ferruginibacter sp.]
MKKRFYLFIITAALLLSLQNCKKGLDTPVPNISEETFFANDAAAVTALAGAYDPLGWGEYSQYLEWAIGDVVSDDAVKGGGGNSDQQQMYDLEHFQANSQTPTLSIVWKQLYIGVNRCNRLIEGITDNANINPATQKRMIAEGKFLRGYYNFTLVKIFGAIPLVDHILSPSEYNMPRNSIVECWAMIEKDFSAAMEDLPKKSDMRSEETGRATWGAAAGYLTKTYIYEEKWPEAEAMAKQIVASNEYKLLPDYANLFKIETDNSTESVFDIQKKAFNTPLYGDAAEASYAEIYQRCRDDRNGGWGFNQPTKDLYDEYEAGDIRRDLTIISDGNVLWQGTPDEETFYTKKDPVHNPDAVTGYCKRKGTLPKSQRGAREDQSGLNIRAIRFAEVLLWQAEAAAHNSSDWQTPLNAVRERVGLGHSPISNPLQAVYHERRVELGMESQRYWDLVRTGRGNLMQGYSDNKRYFPIPQIELNLNPKLTQNPY